MTKMFAVSSDGKIIARFSYWDEAVFFANLTDAQTGRACDILNLEHDADDPAYWRNSPLTTE